MDLFQLFKVRTNAQAIQRVLDSDEFNRVRQSSETAVVKKKKQKLVKIRQKQESKAQVPPDFQEDIHRAGLRGLYRR